MIELYPPKCPDEEHTTCSGGSVAKERGTSRLAQGSEGSQKLRHIVRTTTSHFLSLNNFIIIIPLFYASPTLLLKTLKTRVNSTRFEAIYSNFRLIGALFNNKIFYKTS